MCVCETETQSDTHRDSLCVNLRTLMNFYVCVVTTMYFFSRIRVVIDVACLQRYFVQEDLCSFATIAGDVATDAVPLLSRRNSQGPTCCSRSPAAKPTPDPVLMIKNIHCSRSLPPRFVWGSVNFDHATSFLHVWSGGACIRWQGRRQRLAHGASTCRSHGTCTCTSCASLLRAPLLPLCTTNLASTGRMILILLSMSFIPRISTYLSRAEGWH